MKMPGRETYLHLYCVCFVRCDRNFMITSRFTCELVVAKPIIVKKNAFSREGVRFGKRRMQWGK